MGDPAPAGKVVDFTAARDEAAKGKPEEKLRSRIRPSRRKRKDAAKPRRGRPPKADKAAPDKAKPPTSGQNVPKQTACRERRSR